MSDSAKNLVLGVTGGIAAYKACELARLMIKGGHNVNVMMTKAACEFVTPLTFQALTGQPVATSLFDLTQESEIGHIRLADEADAIVIAPATADFIAKAAHGLADNIVNTVLLASKAKVFVAPSMNVNMYENPLTQKNIQILKELGYQIIDPEEGELACGWQGIGRLADPQRIFEQVCSGLSS